jgi:hypothetical protein
MEIVFSGQATLDSPRDLVWFSARADGKPIRCAISFESLIRRYRAMANSGDDEFLRVFTESRDEIEKRSCPTRS